MKLFLFLLALSCVPACLADSAAPAAAPAPDNYPEFLAACAKRENVVECIALMDRLITAGEHGLVDKEPDLGMVDGTTRFGLRIEFSTTDIKEAIVYYLRISRAGKPLRYDDAAKFAALFTDRAGLPHPVNLTEGDRSTFCAEWLFKPSSWKAMHKMMDKVRAENRAETDPVKVFLGAVSREVEARYATQQQQQR